MAELVNDELRGIVERIERLEEEKKGLSEDVRDIYTELKSRGYDGKMVRHCIKLRKMDKEDIKFHMETLETYGAQLGLF